MQITARLSDEVFAAYDYGSLALGTPLEFIITADVLFGAEQDDPPGWCAPSDPPHAQALTPVCQNLYAFSGPAVDVLAEEEEDGRYYHVLVDSLLPISLLGATLSEDWSRARRAIPRRGQWLSGLAYMNIDWAEGVDAPLSQPLSASIVGIDRLVLRSGPGFGEVRSEAELLSLPLGPDQVFLTLNVRR